MKIVRDEHSLKEAINALKEKGSVGFVPTMGALHSGHISLVERSGKECDSTVVSIFVNPTQFNDKNDLAAYPRTEEADCLLLQEAGCSLVFVPSVEVIYPSEDNRRFDFGTLETVMEGASRPGHFNGVGQVVSRLFDMVEPHKAFFGEKDFQQLAIIRKMTRDMAYDIEIVGCATQRADDGLALSSRNMLLSDSQRAAAPLIYATMQEALGQKSSMSVSQLKEWVANKINTSSELETEYFTIVDSSTLADISSWDDTSDIRACVAVRCGAVRLIDNVDFN